MTKLIHKLTQPTLTFDQAHSLLKWKLD